MEQNAATVLKTELQAEYKQLDKSLQEYVVGLTLDETLEQDDLVETIFSLMGHYFENDDEDAARDKITQVCVKIRQEKENGGENGDEKKLLDAPLNIGTKLKDEEATVLRMLRSHMKVAVNTNEDLESGPVMDLDDDLDEKALRHQMKNEKKLARKERQQQNREKKFALMRDELLKHLVNKPVKLHVFGEIEKGGREIKLESFNMSLPNLELLTDCNVTFVDGRKYGLVGRNGIGKTTFLKHLASKAFKGIPEHLQILHIQQEVEATNTSVLDTVLDCDIERKDLLQESEVINLLEDGKELTDAQKEVCERNELSSMTPDERADRLSDIFDRLRDIESDTSASQAAEILSGLGFSPEMQQLATSRFSGGWRMRIALAQALFIAPDVLLLDEPTNHLDLHSVLWLEDHLANWKNTLVIVSHDRDFLNLVSTDILHMHHKTIDRYKGNYDHFEEKRLADAKLLDKQRENQEKKKQQMQTFIDKNRVNANTAKMAQSRIKALSRIAALPENLKDPSFLMKFPEPAPLQGSAIEISDVSFKYNDKMDYLFRKVNLNVTTSSRVALVGNNGVGKSTFLKLLFEEYEANEGIIKRNPHVKMARFTQHHMDQLEPKKSPLQWFKDMYPTQPPQLLRQHLGSMGVTGNLQLQPIYSLSGGQKSRVAIAHLTYLKPNIILMDEPTNHLDMDTINSLIGALNQYTGGVVIVSHDAHLITAVCDELWICEDNKIKQYKGDFDDYRKELLKATKPQMKAQAPPKK